MWLRWMASAALVDRPACRTRRRATELPLLHLDEVEDARRRRVLLGIDDSGAPRPRQYHLAGVAHLAAGLGVEAAVWLSTTTPACFSADYRTAPGRRPSQDRLDRTTSAFSSVRS